VTIRRGGRRGVLLLAAVVCLLGRPPAFAEQAAPSDDSAILAALRDADLSDKGALVQRLAVSGRPWARAVLAALLDNRLYARQRDGRVFIVRSNNESTPSVELIDPLTGAGVGPEARNGVVQIGTNNHLRALLRVALARFDLTSADRDKRLTAVEEMLRSLDDDHVSLLKAQRTVERDRQVRQEIDVGLALAALNSGDAQARLDAVRALRGELRPDARNRLAALLERSAVGGYSEPDERVRIAAGDAVRAIDRRRAVYGGVQTLGFGLSVGAVLVLVAIGLAITFGLMGVINMAHGELMMLGAYTTYVVQLAMPHHIGASIIVAVPAAFLIAGAAGVILERTVIRFLYGRPLETLLATFGVSLILQQLVRSLFSANNRAVETPQWMSGTLAVNEALSLTVNRLYIIGFTLVIFGVLQIALKRTRVGLYIRAVSQNRAMAQAMGVRAS
jgi:urea transport system permease protein